MRNVKLSEIKVTVRGVGDVPIPSSPYFTSLKSGNRAPYDAYIKKHGLTQDTWEKFQQTKASIRHKGIKIQAPFIRLTNNNVITDGHHRVSILYLLFGPKVILRLDDSHTVRAVRTGEPL